MVVLCCIFNTVFLEVLINLDFAHFCEESWQPKDCCRSRKRWYGLALAYLFHLYLGQGGLQYHASDLSVTTCHHRSGNYSVAPMHLNVQQSASGTGMRHTIPLKKICCLQHWQGLGKCSWGSDFTWNLPFKLTGLVNNVLRKRLKMWASFPGLSLVFCVTLVIFSRAYFCHFFAIETWIMMPYPLCVEAYVIQ